MGSLVPTRLLRVALGAKHTSLPGRPMIKKMPAKTNTSAVSSTLSHAKLLNTQHAHQLRHSITLCSAMTPAITASTITPARKIMFFTDAMGTLVRASLNWEEAPRRGAVASMAVEEARWIAKPTFLRAMQNAVLANAPVPSELHAGVEGAGMFVCISRNMVAASSPASLTALNTDVAITVVPSSLVNEKLLFWERRFTALENTPTAWSVVASRPSMPLTKPGSAAMPDRMRPRDASANTTSAMCTPLLLSRFTLRACPQQPQQRQQAHQYANVYAKKNTIPAIMRVTPGTITPTMYLFPGRGSLSVPSGSAPMVTSVEMMLPPLL